ncbi:Molybdenum cofactor biosynthesis protein MoaA [Dehalobacter sp. UNSWDHB]|nr:radical SAM (seleno)protein TrsS [Dehalobacter sp. UNSWDHB]EQB22717.1 Molybdenum cofactor biosynthesis protein MoaA [Dehalobacter sp. UNSWDHB]
MVREDQETNETSKIIEANEMNESNERKARRKVLKETVSVCPVCLERIPAQKTAYGDNIYLEKTCPEHGDFKSLVWEGKPRYQVWLRQEDNTKPVICDTETERGCPYDCGICPQHEQQACCVLIELTQRCNQNCRFCFADAGHALAEMSLEEISSLYDSLLERSPGRPFNIQLSGGEPTLRKDLAEIIRLGKEKGFPYIQVNSNGKLLAADPAYAQSLAAAGLDCVFLQFDGTDDDVYREIRSEPLLAVKKQAIKNCGQAGVSVVLVVTVVPGVNDGQIGTIVDFLLANLPAVRGIHFQPVSYFGRFPNEPSDEMRYTIPKLLRDLEDQTQGRLRTANFIPLATGHSLCSFHGTFQLNPDGQIAAISTPPEKACCSCGQDAIIGARNYLGRKWGARTGNALGGSKNDGDSGVGSEHGEPAFDDWDLFIKQIHENGFNITAMAFQDVWNIDLERLHKCRVHVATPTYKLIPFCAYNLTDQEGRSLYGRYC